MAGVGLGTLRVALGAEPVSIDPRTVIDDAGELIARALYEGLVDITPAGGIRAAGAESWRLSADGTEYRFRLRRTTFHDGRPVTARDHADALLAVFDRSRPPYGREVLLAGLRGAVVSDEEGRSRPGRPDDVVAAGGVEVAGTWDLILRLERPDPRFLWALSDIGLAPVPPGSDGGADAAATPVGNGPFRLLEVGTDEGFLRLVAVDDHHRRPRVDEVVFRFHPDDPDGTRRWDDLVAGRVQIAELPASRRGEALATFGRAGSVPPDSTVGYHDAPLAAVYAYAFDTRVPPFDDVRLRRALAAAVDRVAVARAAGDGAVPADRLLPPGLLSTAAAGPGCPHCAVDVPLARREFAAWVEATGASVPLPLTLAYPRRTDHASVAEAVAVELERVLEVRVALRALDLPDLTAAIASGEAAIFRPPLRSALGGDAAASSLLDPAFRSEASGAGLPTGWGDQTSDALLDTLRAGPDPATVAALDRALTDDAVVLPLLWFRQGLVVAPGVRGFAIDPTGRWWPESVALD